MGVDKLILRFCKQTAVYWGNPQDDGKGGKTYDNGVEIVCRWNDSGKEVRITTNGKEYISTTQVLVTQDLDVEGYLYLGTLVELDAVGLNKLIYDFKPKEMDGAYEIKRFSKVPDVKARQFVRTAYL